VEAKIRDDFQRARGALNPLPGVSKED
jgi:hypothetical protein